MGKQNIIREQFWNVKSEIARPKFECRWKSYERNILIQILYMLAYISDHFGTFSPILAQLRDWCVFINRRRKQIKILYYHPGG